MLAIRTAKQLLLFVLFFLFVNSYAAVQKTELFLSSEELSLSACDPIDPSACWFPFPNNFWLRNGQLELTPESLPVNADGNTIDPSVSLFNAADGFSAAMPIMTGLLGNISLHNLPSWKNISSSLEVNASPTVLINAETGELVPHYSEQDARAADMRHDGVLTIVPAIRLKDGTRYVVGIRNVLDRATLEPVATSLAFTQLRDKLNSTDPDVNQRRNVFETEIFPILVNAGVQRATLQLAWDFTTASKANVTAQLTFMRDDAFERTTEAVGGVQYKVGEIEEDFSEWIQKKVTVFIKVPQYVDHPYPPSRLVLDTEGVPVFIGKYEWAPFTMLIPRSVYNNSMSVSGVFQYGHGLFSNRSEVESNYLMRQANAFGYVMVASNWLGLSNEDMLSIALMMKNDMSNFAIIPDRTRQGVTQALLVMRTMMQPFLRADPLLVLQDGSPLLPPVSSGQTPAFYAGNSAGSILGTVYMAMSTDVTRGCLGVGGGPFSLLLPRSLDFKVDGLYTSYPSRVARSFLFGLFELLWMRAEASGYIGYTVEDTIKSSPSKQLLFQDALGDAQVNFVGAYILPRTVGATAFESNCVYTDSTDYGFQYVPDDSTIDVQTASAVLVTYAYEDVPEDFLLNIPATPNEDTHKFPRREPTAIRQMHEFFMTGNVINTCKGACLMPHRAPCTYRDCPFPNEELIV